MSKKRQMIEAINAFVVGCKSDNIWDSIKACCILSGWNNLDGCLTPIKGDAPTNYNFVANDYNLLTGLQGDGSTKYLDSNRAMNADPLNDQHVTIYASAVIGGPACHIGANQAGSSSETGITQADPQFSADLYFKSRSNTIVLASNSGLASRFIGLSRTSGLSFNYRINNTNNVAEIASSDSVTINIFVFARGRSSNGADIYSDARLAFYSIGEALDLELLDNRVSTLIKDLAKPYVTNVEAKNWIDRVYDNGGTVSQATANAVSSFCDSIESAGIRDRFYRLNLFAGDNLNAALVPLYTGPTYGGSTYGNAVDENNNFVSGDYNETGANGGLIGNGSTKYLNTAITPNALPTLATGHISAYAVGTTATNDFLLGLRSSGNVDFYEITKRGDDRHHAAWGSSNVAYPINPISNNDGPGFFLASRTASNLLTFYRDAINIATQTANVTPGGSDRSFVVFASTGSSVTGHYLGRLSAYSIGDGMTAQQGTDFYNAIQTFQTSLNRNV